MRAGIAVGAVGAAVTGMLWWGAQDQSRTLDPQNAATALVPPDGYRVVGEDAGGRAYLEEDARLTGAVAISGTPPLVGGALLSLHPEFMDLRVWRSVQTPLAADPDPATGLTTQDVTLSAVTSRGVEELALYGTVPLVFDPPLLEVPSDVHDGAQWSGRGDAYPGGAVTYTATTTAHTAAHDCFHLTGRVVLSIGTKDFPQPVDETWCPGRGLVPAGPATSPPWTGSTTPLTTTADDVSGWSAAPLPLVLASSLADLDTTGGPLQIGLDLPPAALADGAMAVVDARSEDVWGLAPVGGSLARAWIGHPGGDIVSLGAAGAATVVTTARREAVGYGDRGQHLWTVSLPDVAVTTPVAADAHHVVLTTVLGDVIALDPHDGHRAWRGTMSDQVGLDPVSDGRHVAVADIAGQLRLFDLVSGDVAWGTELPAPADAVGIVGDEVVVAMGGSVQALALDDGSRRWTAVDDGAGSGSRVADVGGTLVVASSSSTVGLDPRTGHRRWTAPGAEVSAALGDVLVQLDGRSVVARNGRGLVAGRWTAPGLDGETGYLVPNGRGVWALDGVGDAATVGP